MADKEVETSDVGTSATESDKEVEALDVEKKPAETGKAADAIQAADECDDEYPTAAEDLADITEMARLLNESDEWIEERRQMYKEMAARSKRIMEDFVQSYGDWINRQLGCVEEEEEEDEDEEEDPEYDANFARMQELNTMLWNEHLLNKSARRPGP
jgi:hypothetical protein